MLLAFLFPIEIHGKGFFTILGVKKFWGNFLTPQGHLLGQTRFFWRIKRQNRFSGLGCTLIHEPKNKTEKQKKCHRRMNMLGMRRGKTRGPIFGKFGKHKFGHDVMTCANFDEISLSGFGNSAVQSYSLPIDNAHYRAHNSLPSTV
jgi:hypothetical protein